MGTATAELKAKLTQKAQGGKQSLAFNTDQTGKKCWNIGQCGQLVDQFTARHQYGVCLLSTSNYTPSGLSLNLGGSSGGTC